MNIPTNYWISGLYLVIGVAVCVALSLLGKGPVKKYAEKNPGKTKAMILQLLCKTPFIFAVTLVCLWFAIDNLHLNTEYHHVIGKAFYVLYVINVSWFLDDLASMLIEKGFSITKDKIKSTNVDANMVKTIDKIVSVIIWSITFVVALSILGIDIKALVATLGIGGVAIALAGQDTAKNLIGGITILGDRIFRIGDRIRRFLTWHHICLLYKAPSHADVFAVNNTVNMKILTRFNKAGLNFAFPTQTVVLDKQ